MIVKRNTREVESAGFAYVVAPIVKLVETPTKGQHEHDDVPGAA